MLLVTFILTTLLSTHHVTAQVFSPNNIPTTAISANYSGPLRPQLHFSPPVGFMNDPNGAFVDASGLYHLYYQYNPTDTIAGNQHWGHATSRDLYTWTNEAIALYPHVTASGQNVTGIFSGSAVIDVNNTSGFFPNQNNGVVAIYTANGATFQEQAIAYSHDDGYTWTQYADNPVIAINSTNFRDPKVVWHASTQKWVMVVAYAVEFTVGIYTSSNLKQWEHQSNFSHHGIIGLQYECPNMVQIPYYEDGANTSGPGEPMWLMYISINPGAPLGGSIGQYFPGDFNGTHFTAVDQVARLADFGKDNYAAQFFYRDGETGTTNDVVSLAWASNWQYTNYVPTGPREGWQSAMSLPRRNHLTQVERIGWILASEPWDLGEIQGKSIGRDSGLGNNTFSATSSTGGPLVLQVNITSLNTTNLANTASLNVTISSSKTNESIRGGQFFGGDPTFWLDRGSVKGFENPYNTDKASIGLVAGDSWDMMLVVDGSVLEVFLLNGTRSATLTYFLSEDAGVLDRVFVEAQGLMVTSIISAEVRELESGWAGQENANGVVSGNVTSSQTKRDGDVEGLGLREWWA